VTQIVDRKLHHSPAAFAIDIERHGLAGRRVGRHLSQYRKLVRFCPADLENDIVFAKTCPVSRTADNDSRHDHTLRCLEPQPANGFLCYRPA
jgi:hypothetical protein